MKKTFYTFVLALTVIAFTFGANMVSATYVADNSEQGVVNSITLSGEGDKINWTVDGYSYKGFKVVWSKNAHPTYPTRSGDKYHYFSSPSKNSDTLSAFDGSGTYYVRVCEYLGGKCGLYSNEITLKLGKDGEDANESENSAKENKVSSITLSGQANKINWTVDGYSKKGFKVVWSKNEHPTYPTRSGDKYHYFSSPNKTSDTLSAFDGSGTYYVRVCEYLGGKCGVYSNEITLSLEGSVDKEVKEIKKKAEKLTNNQLDDILAELKELRSLVKEQQTQIKYLQGLISEVGQIAKSAQDALNNFIAYGVDDNTKKLGEGERAAVIYSFKNAFGKLPESESELEDAIKIANGRWPSSRSEVAEEKAKELFRKIYLRNPNENNMHDNAAIVIMSYGLRQRAENRNLESERKSLAIFKSIFGHLPQNTEEWNALQAIAYSGASR